VQDGPPGAVDRPDGGRLEPLDVPPGAGRVGGVDLEEPCPATPYPHDLVTRMVGAHHDGFDAGVQSGDVSTAREHGELHGVT
jgi:hypothetical protein